MITIADQARSAEDPYAFSFARFCMRTTDREALTVTHHFADGSQITFQIKYEVQDDSRQDD